MEKVIDTGTRSYGIHKRPSQEDASRRQAQENIKVCRRMSAPGVRHSKAMLGNVFTHIDSYASLQRYRRP